MKKKTLTEGNKRGIQKGNTVQRQKPNLKPQSPPPAPEPASIRLIKGGGEKPRYIDKDGILDDRPTIKDMEKYYNEVNTVFRIWFRVPFTEYFLGRHMKVCLFRKIWKLDRYFFVKI